MATPNRALSRAETLRPPGRLLLRAFVWFLAFASFLSAGAHASEQPADLPPDASGLVSVLFTALHGPAASHLRLAQQVERLDWLVGALPSERPAIHLSSEGFGFSGGRERNAVDNLRYSQAVPGPSFRRAQREFQRAAERLSDSRAEWVELDLLARTARAWIRWTHLLARGGVYAGRLDRLERALAIYSKRYELGEVAGSEVRQLEAQRASDLAAIELNRAAIRKARFEVASLSGMEPRPVDAKDFEALFRGLNGAAGLSKASSEDEGGGVAPFERRLEARLELDRSQAELFKRRAAGIPSLTLEYERVPELSDGSFRTPAFDALGFTLTVPIAVGRAHRERRSLAIAEIARAEGKSALGGQRIRFELDARWEDLRATERVLDSMESTRAQLETSEHSLHEQFRLGAIPYLTFLDGLKRLDEVRLQALDIERQWLESRIGIAQLSGDPIHFPPIAEVMVSRKSRFSNTGAGTSPMGEGRRD